MDKTDLSKLRREYGDIELESTLESPFQQFDAWLNDLLALGPINEMSMILSSVDADGYPDARVVLLKGIVDERFVFYTDYHSAKGIQIADNPHVALTLYWPELSRQIRVRGVAKKTSIEQSDQYFKSRPVLSQLAAIASKQSQVIECGREDLLKKLHTLAAEVKESGISRPPNWGGYAVEPFAIEFWQGRNHRLHDRILYRLINNQWQQLRLAP